MVNRKIHKNILGKISTKDVVGKTIVQIKKEYFLNISFFHINYILF